MLKIEKLSCFSDLQAGENLNQLPTASQIFNGKFWSPLHANCIVFFSQTFRAISVINAE
jgi:hypothetical protein